MVYDMYESIVYDTKDYYDITRSKMLDAILKEYSQQHYLVNMCTIKELEFLEYALNNKINAKDLLEVINEGLDDTPCAVMNGFTPNEYAEEKLKEKEFKFNKIPQNNAHLCRKAADEFYK